MAITWENLHGKDLTDFASSPHSKKHKEKFAQHLEKNGSEYDFAQWIKQKDDPFCSALEMLDYCPTVARPWIIKALKTSTDPQWHYEAATYPNSYPRSLLTGKLLEICEDILKHVKYECILPQYHEIVFNVLLRSQIFAPIETNWPVFKEFMAAAPEKTLRNAAASGLDLHDKLPAPVDTDAYFRACAAGKLLHRIKQYRVDPSQCQVINMAFALNVFRNHETPDAMEEVAQYLWTTYPHQPWHTSAEMLGLLTYNISLPLAQKIVNHHQEHAPHKLKNQAGGITSHAVYENKHKLFALMLPYVEPSELCMVYGCAIKNQRKKFLRQLLQHTNHSVFFEALTQCNTKEQNWANAFYSACQHKKVSTNISHTQPPSQSARKKKM